MRILFVASEVDPFAKTGGLADVAGALPKALAQLGHEVRVVMPLYREVNRERFGLRPTEIRVAIPVGPKTHEGRVWEARLPGATSVPAAKSSTRATATPNPVIVYFIEQPQLFDRDGLYQHQGKDFQDNLERFSFFSQAALRMLPLLRFQPDIVHCHDWQTALACAHMALGSIGQDPFFRSIGMVLTIHNLAYQGLFPAEQWPLTQLPTEAFSIQGLEFYGQINGLKGGLISADLLTTVSPTYAKEILTEAFGCGLEGVLRTRQSDVVGILNGIDPEAWDSTTDPWIPAHYSAENLAGKALCKLALQQRQHLPERHDLLIGMIQRLAEQKGIDLFVQAMDELMALPMQIVLLGTGDPVYHRQLEKLAAQFPKQLAVNLTFDNALAHQIEAGSDAFLMPSRFEPCGLNQMYSMRFGTVPIVKRVGGLADTVIDVNPSTIASNTATGFVFEEHTASALVQAMKRTLAAFRDQALWTSLMRHGMRRDVSWHRSARAYVDVYERASAKKAPSATARNVRVAR